jgi:predicted dienelactone hydrolase
MSRARAVVLAGALASAISLAACTDSTPASAPPGGSTAPAASTTTTKPRPYEVGTREITYVDASRPTQKNNSFPGAPTRTIPVIVSYPARNGAPATDGAPFATILFNHGHNGHPEQSAQLIAEFVRTGYVVVAPLFPLSRREAPGGPTVIDIADQPADAKFALDHVLAARDAPWLQGLVDPERIGTFGHSLGGLTTYGLVYNSCCTDERIKAAVVLSGLAGGFDGEFFEGITTPLYAIHGEDDPTVPHSSGYDAYLRANPPKYFLTIIGGSHSTEEQGGTTPGQQAVAKSMLAFFDRYVRGDETALQRMRKAATVPGVTTFEAPR